jgi:carbamoyl-phosphate synthase small subunit
LIPTESNINMKKAKLILDDGEEYIGESFGFNSSASGEVVFNTGMTGYPQSLTDPSYAGQILVFTYPLIGNYGVGRPKKDKFGIPLNFESRGIHVKGVVVSEYCERPNHWDADMSIKEWLIKNKIPAISGIDTRALAIKLRSKGVMLGRVFIENIQNYQSKRENVEFYNPDRYNLVKEVSRKDVSILGKGKHRIVVVDCGIKNNILRCLLKRDTTLIIVPWDYDFNGIDYDGLFISNGPGNPEYCSQTINNIKIAIKKKNLYLAYA